MDKIMKELIRTELLGVADKLTFHHDGTITAKRSFFYRHGGSSEKMAQRILARIPKSVIIEQDEVWANWPKDSYWKVKFEVREFHKNCAITKEK